ncbi:CHASE2 domain-containing protein [Geitlerinema sp. PCC 9228]|uniref:CHASE2 domain-containing protein n=1 Tax=Geitlerinema sp. PCC 9228 TaxID=111611 RepID=UPI0008F9B902|nr:CHASE2 domain-containing protein [Geitlerinema sp. PCC 9228]
MNHLAILNLGNGDWESGFANAIAQLWHSDRAAPRQWTGALPPLPALGESLQAWRRHYEALYAHTNWRRHIEATIRHSFDIDEGDITHISPAEFERICQQVRTHINRWLQAETFHNIDRGLRTHLSPTDEIRLIFTAQNQEVLRLPWHLWQFFEDYPHAEPALSLPTYGQAVKMARPRETIRILVVLGNAQGIDLSRDRALLENLPHTTATVLVEPNRDTLNRHLWEAQWDLLFFAGHSSSRASTHFAQGCLQLNPTESLTLEDLRYGLKRAIAHGLKLAIFNSCDGLGLAWDLADLHVPQVIVMREPVPDCVAQMFLQQFLQALVGGQSLYQAVREAREKLQGWEDRFPCATWLPVIYQNPAEASTNWESWWYESLAVPNSLSGERAIAFFGSGKLIPGYPLLRAFVAALAVASTTLGIRAVGAFQSMELWAFDRLQILRPAEPTDHRFLIVTLEEADIQAQPEPLRNGSLSDRALEQVLEKLERHQPRVIGLDIYRDRATNAQNLAIAQALRHDDRLIVVCKSRDQIFDPVGIAPPPEVPEHRVGFSDFLEDTDGVLRRQIVSMTPEPASPCTTPYSFSSRLAFRYLQAEGITPQFTPEGNLQLGRTVLKRIQSYWGGYQDIDAAGNQLMVNYRALLSPDRIAPQITLSQLLAGQVAPDAIRDRIVLLGVTAVSTGDYWITPFGSSRAQRVAGVFVQAHMTSQLIAAALNKRPILWVWPLAIEAMWLLGWSLLGYGIAKLRHFLLRTLTMLLSIGVLTGICFVLLLVGGWIPLVPTGIAMVVAAGIASLDFSKHTK